MSSMTCSALAICARTVAYAASPPMLRRWRRILMKVSLSTAFVKMSASISVVGTNAVSMMSRRTAYLTSIVARSKYLDLCVVPSFLMMSIIAELSPRSIVGPLTQRLTPSSTVLTAIVAFVAQDACAVSAFAVLCGTVPLNARLDQSTAAFKRITACPPYGIAAFPHDESVAVCKPRDSSNHFGIALSPSGTFRRPPSDKGKAHCKKRA